MPVPSPLSFAHSHCVSFLLQIAIKNEPCSTAVTKEEPGLISTAAAKAEVKSVFGGCGSSGTSMLRAVAYSGPFPGWGAPSAAACHQVVQRLADLHGMPSVQRRASGGRPQVGCEEKRSVLDSLVRWALEQRVGGYWQLCLKACPAQC